MSTNDSYMVTVTTTRPAFTVVFKGKLTKGVKTVWVRGRDSEYYGNLAIRTAVEVRVRGPKVSVGSLAIVETSQGVCWSGGHISKVERNDAGEVTALHIIAANGLQKVIAAVTFDHAE